MFYKAILSSESEDLTSIPISIIIYGLLSIKRKQWGQAFISFIIMAHRNNEYLGRDNKVNSAGWVARCVSARSGRGSPRGMGGARTEIYRDRTHPEEYALRLLDKKVLIIAMSHNY
jgi:hypothetical protein